MDIHYCVKVLKIVAVYSLKFFSCNLTETKHGVDVSLKICQILKKGVVF